MKNQELGQELSWQTLTRIQMKIDRIRMFHEHFLKLKKILQRNEHAQLYRVYFDAIAPQYRSLFRKLDGDHKIDIQKLKIKVESEVYDNHLQIMNYADNEIIHLDKSSKPMEKQDSRKLEDVQTSATAFDQLSEDRFEATMNFLSNEIKPIIQEAISIASKK